MEKNMNGVYQLSTGKELVFRYDYVGCFIEGLAKVRLKGKYGFVDKTGREVIPLKYDDAYGLDKGLATVKLNGKWGMINCLGIEVVPLIFNNICMFNFAVIVKLGNKYGLLNYNREYILPCQYDEINVFDGRIIAEKSDINYEFNLFGELINILTDTETNCLYYDFGRRPFV